MRKTAWARARPAVLAALVLAGLLVAIRPGSSQDVVFETLTLTLDSVLVNTVPAVSLSGYTPFTVTLTAEPSSLLRFRAASGGQTFEVSYMPVGLMP